MTGDTSPSRTPLDVGRKDPGSTHRWVGQAATRAAIGEAATCQVATGIGTSTRAIHDLIAAAVGWEQPPLIEPERPGDIQRIELSPARARERWGWEPRIPLDEGIRRTVEWFRAHV